MQVESIGGRLRLVREALGMNRTELAELLNTTGATVSRWESGDIEIRANDLPRIAGALGVSATLFFLEQPWDDLARALAEVYRILNEAKGKRSGDIVEPEMGHDGRADGEGGEGRDNVKIISHQGSTILIH